MKNLGTQTGISVARLIRRIQEIYERISDTEATLGEINSLIKENVWSKNLLSQKNEKKIRTLRKFRYKTIGNKGGKKTKTQTIFSTKT